MARTYAQAKVAAESALTYADVAASFYAEHSAFTAETKEIVRIARELRAWVEEYAL